MLTFILFLMGMFVMWRWVLYLWCDSCENKVRTAKSRFCATCQAEMDLALEKMLDSQP